MNGGGCCNKCGFQHVQSDCEGFVTGARARCTTKDRLATSQVREGVFAAIQSDCEGFVTSARDSCTTKDSLATSQVREGVFAAIQSDCEGFVTSARDSCTTKDSLATSRVGEGVFAAIQAVLQRFLSFCQRSGEVDTNLMKGRQLWLSVSQLENALISFILGPIAISTETQARPAKRMALDDSESQVTDCSEQKVQNEKHRERFRRARRFFEELGLGEDRMFMAHLTKSTTLQDLSALKGVDVKKFMPGFDVDIAPKAVVSLNLNTLLAIESIPEREMFTALNPLGGYARIPEWD